MALSYIQKVTLKVFCFLSASIYLISFNLHANDAQMKSLINDITKMYMSSMVYVFKSQPIINDKNIDKKELLGKRFIDNIKQTYRTKYNEEFPKEDHFAKTLLLQAMVEVMDDNKALLYDDEIGFKGIIPATFAFQLSAKLSTKGVGLKIKFTRTDGQIRNKLNRPDSWESRVMQKMQKKPQIYYDENALLNGKAAIRQFTPLPMAHYCLACHGIPDNNPLNTGRKRSEWTNIDITGFEMENWTIDDFGGGVSISIEKSVLK
jgi:hypothetical protein